MNTMDCKTCRTQFPDLLFPEPGVNPEPLAAAHLAGCPECSTELRELQATYALLEEWTAPEPSPYFDSRVCAHLREAAQAEPAGLWERLASTLRFSTGRGLRPAMAGALALILLLGGGTAATLLEHGSAAKPTAASPTVNDLRIFDNNAQAVQQLDLLDEPGTDAGGAGPQS